MPGSTRRIFKWTGRVLIGIAVLVAGVIALGVYNTYATRLPSCDQPKEVATVRSLRDLPQALRDETFKRVPDLADRGSAFNATDVVDGYGAQRRFVTAARAGSRWVIGYEQGGIGYMVKILAFDQQDIGSFVLSSHRYSSPNSFCSDITARLRDEPLPADRPNVPERHS
jgi:hypothetical protein